MKETLYQLAKEYVEVLDKIEKTKDPKDLSDLDEKRIRLHGLFMDKLREQGIRFKDRDHATRIAQRIAKEEL